MTRTGRGFTLIEIMMATLVGAVMLVGVFHLFSSVLSTTRKGSSHLTNLQTASIILSQFEKDLSLMVAPLPDTDGNSGKLSVRVLSAYGEGGVPATAEVEYRPGPAGIGYRRTETRGEKSRTHVFGSDLKVQVTFERLVIKASGRTGYNVRVTVRNPLKGTETNSLRRFIYCYNLPQNRGKSPQNWNF